ncbi:MAG: uracil-DNA glycosylase [Hyphomicrobiales bacterium]
MPPAPSIIAPEPPPDCPRCPRLVQFRRDNRAMEPDWHNAPVDSFGCEHARLLVVGLAPGLKGANRTGRPFTGDYAGDLLYGTLLKFGFAEGDYQARPDDGLRLRDCMITNAVRCVPPQNKPVGSEIASCRPFLAARMDSMPRLRTVLVLGRIAHDSVLAATAVRRSAFTFAHAARHQLPEGRTLFDSYHCSRYNTNTGRLTQEMFEAVFRAIRAELDG